MVKKQLKFTPRYKEALIRSIIQAMDDNSIKFTQHEIRCEVEAERFVVIGEELHLTSYRPIPRFRLENPPCEELLQPKNSKLCDDSDVEGELEVLG